MQGMPDVVYVERWALSPDTRAVLEGRGYKFKDRGYWGVAEAILAGGPAISPTGGFGEDGFLPVNARPEAGGQAVRCA